MSAQDDGPNDQPALAEPQDAPDEDAHLSSTGLVPPSAADVGAEPGDTPGDEPDLPTVLDADLLGGPT